MKSLRELSFREIAFEICSAFDRANVCGVLVGGGAAAFYAPNAYETRDLDFVLHLELFGIPNRSILDDLGFTQTRTSGTYAHPEIRYTLEILPGPLGIGDEILETFETFREGDRVLHIISPTDSVRDRLAHAIHFRDLNAVKQAVEVAKVQVIDQDKVRTGCRSEGGSNVLEMYEALQGA